MSTVPAARTAGSTRQVIRQLSPLITMAATWVVRKALINAYEGRTGQPAPLIYSRGPSPARKVIWAATVAGTVALIEVIILELIDKDD